MYICRISTNIENKDNERKISNIQDNAHAIRNMNEKYENNLEILISPGEYDNPINDFQKLNILKFLVRDFINHYKTFFIN